MKERFSIVVTWLILVVVVACASQPQQMTSNIQCPSDSVCDPNVTPPPMTQAEINYHLEQRDLADDVLTALVVEDMAWRSCWDCYSNYYSRYPSLYSQRNYYYSLPPSQRVTVVKQQNITVINKNTTIIQQRSATVPQTVKSAPVSSTAPKPPASSSGSTSSSTSSSSTTASKPASPGTCSGCGGVAGGSNFKPSAPAPAVKR